LKLRLFVDSIASALAIIQQVRRSRVLLACCLCRQGAWSFWEPGYGSCDMRHLRCGGGSECRLPLAASIVAIADILHRAFVSV